MSKEKEERTPGKVRCSVILGEDNYSEFIEAAKHDLTLFGLAGREIMMNQPIDWKVLKPVARPTAVPPNDQHPEGLTD